MSTPPPSPSVRVPSGPGPPHYQGFTMTPRHTTHGRTPLDEWSAWCRDFYLTTCNTHKRQTSTPPAGLESMIRASERMAADRHVRLCYEWLQTDTSDHATNGCRPTRQTVWRMAADWHVRPCDQWDPPLVCILYTLYHGSTAVVIDVPLLKSSLQNVSIIQSCEGNILPTQSAGDYYIYNPAKVFIIPIGF
jgi:hypothetical protein